MRKIGKLCRLKGQLIRCGRGMCLRHEADGALWPLNMEDNVPELLGRPVCVEGILSATETLDVYWIGELAGSDPT
ncbi:MULTISPECIES: DUF5818 domain-containing protein [Sphingobium]|nr:hypothetical protein sphantq_00632 [Sphingobium sp. AntQ-1]